MQEKWDQQAGSIFFWKWGGQTYPKSSTPPPQKNPSKIPIFKIIIRRGGWTSIFLSFTACSQKMEEASSKIQMWMKAGWGDATWVVRIRNNSKFKKKYRYRPDTWFNLQLIYVDMLFFFTCWHARLLLACQKYVIFFFFPIHFIENKT